MKSKIILTLLLLIPITSYLYGESYKVRKLIEELQNTGNPEKKVGLLLDIANELKGSLPDSALYYYAQAEKSSLGLSREKKDLIAIKVMVGRASVQIAKGNYAVALSLDSIALKEARRLKNRELEAAVLLSQGGIYYNQSDFETAQKLNLQALKVNRTTADRKTEGKILTNMGTVEFMFGNFAKADSLFKLPLGIAQKLGDDDLLAASYLNMGLLNVYMSNYGNAEKYLLQSEAIYKAIDGKDGLVLCYQNLSNIWFGKGDFGKAIEYNTLNQNLSIELGDKIGLSKAYQNLGECHSQIGDYEKALDFFIKALKIKTGLGDKKGVAISSSSIGHIHYLRSDFNKALGYYRKSLQDNTEIGYAIGIAASCGDIGTILSEQNKLDSALYYFQKAEKVYVDCQSDNMLSNVYLNIGKTHITKKEFVKAEDYLKKAESIKIQLDDKPGIYNVWSLFSTMYFDKSKLYDNASGANKNELKIALGYSVKAYNLAISSNNLPGQSESAGHLVDIYSNLGNESAALKYAKIKIQVSDSLDMMQREEALANAETRWKAERKQTEIDQLKNEKLLQSQIIEQKDALTNRLLALIGAIILLLFLLIIVAVFYAKNKAKTKAIEYQKHLNEIIQLKMQNINNRLSPHLFFNVLNAVSADANEPEKVKSQINQIALLLRRSLESTELASISIADELEMVKSYLELQNNRIPKPFSAEFHISEHVDLNIQIPPMMLQIPIENAIKHGLMPLEGHKNLDVTIEKKGGNIELCVADNGIGREKSKGRTTGTGTGLKVLLQTIRLLNQQNQEPITFDISDGNPQGTIVKISIPINYSFQPQH
ncbi:MAG: tetratricopeptide repeat protein [Bacteroidales bacterium]